MSRDDPMARLRQQIAKLEALAKLAEAVGGTARAKNLRDKAGGLRNVLETLGSQLVQAEREGCTDRTAMLLEIASFFGYMSEFHTHGGDEHGRALRHIDEWERLAEKLNDREKIRASRKARLRFLDMNIRGPLLDKPGENAD